MDSKSNRSSITISAVGDIMPGGMLSGINEGFVSNEILKILNSADIRVGTLETAIGSEPIWEEGKMQRLGDVIYAKDVDVNKLKTLNIDIVSLANNHVFDLGSEGIRHTIEVLDKMGIKHCGAGMNIEEASKPVVIEKNNKTIAFVAFCDWRLETTGWCLMASENSAGVNPLYDNHVEEQIKQLKSKYDYVVVIPHWGKEHTYWTTNMVYRLADDMLKWGADVVLGGHTHRIQPVVLRKKKCVAYSMGNFLFIDRIIVHPRSTWYPDDDDEFDINSIPRTNCYPYVEEPTLKCSPEKNRVGLIVKVSLNEDSIGYQTFCTQMDGNCNISLYSEKNPTRTIKRIIDIGAYPVVNWARLNLLRVKRLGGKIIRMITRPRVAFSYGSKMIIKHFLRFSCFVWLISKLCGRKNHLGILSFDQFKDLLREYSPSSFSLLRRKQLKKTYYDWVKCLLKDGIEAKDYLAYDWINRSEFSRSNYITARINSNMYQRFDTSYLCPIMADKARFNYVYREFIKRDWLYVCKNTKFQEFESFCKRHGVIVVKPRDGQRGQGVHKADVSADEKLRKVWQECLDDKCVVEALIKQGELSKLHKESVNTVRISTAVDENNTPHIVASSIRCGRGGNFVDNAHSGGLFCGIDVESGIIISEGIDKTNAHYMCHPDTGVQFLGMHIPQWDELKKIAIKAASVIPGLRYIGWDWVLCEDGHWELLEGNEPGNPDVLQLGRNCGLLSEFSKYLK